MEIKITKKHGKDGWYNDCIGKKYKVIKEYTTMHGDLSYVVKIDECQTEYFVLAKHCKVLTPSTQTK